MEIVFLGTGAADWDWSKGPRPGIRGSTCTLIDGHILLDAGPTAAASLKNAGFEPAEITDLVFTHSHSDHCNPENIRLLAEAPGRKAKLRIHATPQALANMKVPMEPHALAFRESFMIGGLRFTPVPANHSVDDLAEETWHFLVDTPEGKRLFYALDGGWLTSRESAVLRTEQKPDMIVWDATSGTSRYDWRFAWHNDLWMIRHQQNALANLKKLDDKTIQVFDHIAKGLWPADPEERKRIAAEFNGILAEDGMKLTL